MIQASKCHASGLVDYHEHSALWQLDVIKTWLGFIGLCRRHLGFIQFHSDLARKCGVVMDLSVVCLWSRRWVVIYLFVNCDLRIRFRWFNFYFSQATVNIRSNYLDWSKSDLIWIKSDWIAQSTYESNLKPNPNPIRICSDRIVLDLSKSDLMPIPCFKRGNYKEKWLCRAIKVMFEIRVL